MKLDPKIDKIRPHGYKSMSDLSRKRNNFIWHFYLVALVEGDWGG